MKEVILIKNGELALKGLNRRTFEDMLMANIRRRLASLGKFTCTPAQSTIIVEGRGCRSRRSDRKTSQGLRHSRTLSRRRSRKGYGRYSQHLR